MGLRVSRHLLLELMDLLRLLLIEFSLGSGGKLQSLLHILISQEIRLSRLMADQAAASLPDLLILNLIKGQGPLKMRLRLLRVRGQDLCIGLVCSLEVPALHGLRRKKIAALRLRIALGHSHPRSTVYADSLLLAVLQPQKSVTDRTVNPQHYFFLLSQALSSAESCFAFFSTELRTIWLHSRFLASKFV